MTRYYGVECKTCQNRIPLAIKKPTLQGNVVTINLVPLTTVDCVVCGNSHMYESSDSIDWEGLDGLLESSVPLE